MMQVCKKQKKRKRIYFTQKYTEKNIDTTGR